MKRLISLVLIACTAGICFVSCVNNKNMNKDIEFEQILQEYSVVEVEKDNISHYFWRFAYWNAFYSDDNRGRPMLNSDEYGIKKILTVDMESLAIFECSSHKNAEKLEKEFLKMSWMPNTFVTKKNFDMRVEGKYLLFGNKELIRIARERIE